MLDVLDPPAHNVIAIRVDGSAADAAADGEALRALLDAARPQAPLGLYVEMGWMWGDTEREFADRVRRGFAELAAREDVERVAFVSGSYPRRTLLRDIGEPVDGVEVSVFPAAARNAAIDWVRQFDAQEAA
ncbi:MAG: STAS/SEC14 domain-containing protein [Bacteroidota bacterium]